jgi:hypothetical protein
MRRLLLTLLASLFGATTLMAVYLAIDLDPDDTAPFVAAPSYESLFQASVRQRTGSTFEALDEARRLKVLTDIVGSKEMAAVREVALHRTRVLANRTAALALLRRHLWNLPEDLFEVGASSLAALGTPAARAYLDSLFLLAERDPASHTPLAGYRASTLVVSEDADRLGFVFTERTRDEASYAMSDASEITLLFPAGPDYFVAMPNADDVLDRFESSRFARALDGSPVTEDAWTLPLLRTVHGLRKRLSENMGFVGRFFSPEELMRDNLLIGRYGEQYLLVSHKDKNVAVAEALVSVFETFGGDFGIRRWRVGETSAAAIVNRQSGRSLSYATLGDYLVVATDTALMTRSLRTFHSDRGRSIGIDPIINATYRAVDASGRRDVLYAWFNPSRYFDVTGSEQPAAYRRAVLARATGRSLVPSVATGVTERLRALPCVISTMSGTADSTADLWRYIVTVRSLGKSPVDSLAKVAGVDIARQIAPYVGRTWSLGYAGVEHLKREYGFSSTAFNLVAAVPLNPAPAGFDESLRRLFAGTTSLVYTADSIPSARARLWIASDTATHDTMLLARKLQPSYAIVDGRLLVVASTPSLLRQAATHFAASPATPIAPGPYATGSVRLDSFATNAARYLRSYLLRTDRYSPEEIARRIDPLRNAIAQYGGLEWSFFDEKGLRRGQGHLGL